MDEKFQKFKSYISSFLIMVIVQYHSVYQLSSFLMNV